jgi:hypothetical protein
MKAISIGPRSHFRPMAIRRTCFRRFWTLLEAKLADLRATSGSSISILNAGCGPGTWLRRLVTRAHVLEEIMPRNLPPVLSKAAAREDGVASGDKPTIKEFRKNWTY